MACGIGVCVGCSIPVYCHNGGAETASETTYERCYDGPYSPPPGLSGHPGQDLVRGKIDMNQDNSPLTSKQVKTEVTVGNVQLKNPVLAASGTFGFGAELAPYCDLSGLGGIC